MNKFILISMLSIVTACSVVGCSPGNNTPGATLLGSGAGALLGSRFGRGGGRVAATMVGAVVGAYAGNRVGQQMDAQDRSNMQQAIVNTPVGQEASWTNEQTHSTYRVRPIRSYHHKKGYCREYQTTVTVNGEVQKAYGTACRQPDGSWHIVKS